MFGSGDMPEMHRIRTKGGLHTGLQALAKKDPPVPAILQRFFKQSRCETRS